MAALNYHARPSVTQDAFCLTDIEQIRRDNPLPAIAGASVKLNKAGREWIGLCPFHSERSPSFTIYDSGQRFKCFGCNATGDVLDFIQAMHGVDFVGALRLVGGGDLPMANFVPADIEREAKADRTPDAIAIWEAAQDATGTIAEAYLRARAITMPLPPTIRFTRLRYEFGSQYPVLVALVQNSSGDPIGIQRTYLDPTGVGKAAVPKPKKSLGKIRGGAVRLGNAVCGVAVCEGLEDGLTLAQELDAPVWVSVGTSNLPSMELPASIRSVIIGADNDDSGQIAARKASDAFTARGLAVRIIQPLDGHKDFNSEAISAARVGAQ